MKINYVNESSRYYQEDIPFDDITDDIIIKIFYNKDTKRIKGTYLSEDWLSRRPNLRNYILTRYNDAEDSSLKEILYRIYHHIDKRPICPVCHKNYIKFNSMSRYNDTCSPKCHRILKNDEIWNTNIRKYGSINPLNDPKIKEKQIQTNIAKYGSPNPFGSEKIREKIKETNREKYGTDYYSQSDTYKKYWKEHVLPRLGEIEEQKYNTHKKNNSFHISAPEKTILQYLLDKFGEEDVYYQYKSEDYPFVADFYIKSKNLYIEYNGNWTHGTHPFNYKNQEDLDRLKYLSEKGETKDYYKVAAYVWSKHDVKKRTYAKEHDLNFIELWTIKEAKDFIDNL